VTAASLTFSATATRIAQPSLSTGAFGASAFPAEMTRVTATSPTFCATATRIARPSLSTGAFGVNPPAHPLAPNGERHHRTTAPHACNSSGVDQGLHTPSTCLSVFPCPCI